MTDSSSWEHFHRNWRRVEAALRNGSGHSATRGPIADLIEAAARTGKLSSATAAELDAFRRLRNLDSHEGIAGSGARLCSPDAEAVARLGQIADQLECPTSAMKVMTKARTCSLQTSLFDAIDALRNGADVLYYRNGKSWCAFDRTQVSRIVERNAKGAKTSVDLERSIGDHLAKIPHLHANVLQGHQTAKTATAALQAVIEAADPEVYQSVALLDQRTVWHLVPARLPSVLRSLIL